MATVTKKIKTNPKIEIPSFLMPTRYGDLEIRLHGFDAVRVCNADLKVDEYPYMVSRQDVGVEVHYIRLADGDWGLDPTKASQAKHLVRFSKRGTPTVLVNAATAEKCKAEIDEAIRAWTTTNEYMMGNAEAIRLHNEQLTLAATIKLKKQELAALENDLADLAQLQADVMDNGATLDPTGEDRFAAAHAEETLAMAEEEFEPSDEEQEDTEDALDEDMVEDDTDVEPDDDEEEVEEEEEEVEPEPEPEPIKPKLTKRQLAEKMAAQAPAPKAAAPKPTFAETAAQTRKLETQVKANVAAKKPAATIPIGTKVEKPAPAALTAAKTKTPRDAAAINGAIAKAEKAGLVKPQPKAKEEPVVAKPQPKRLPAVPKAPEPEPELEDEELLEDDELLEDEDEGDDEEVADEDDLDNQFGG